MSAYAVGDVVRVRTTDDTNRDGVAGERGVVVAHDRFRPVVSIDGVELALDDDELDLEEDA